tara:strand:+ start:537 stop:728 length:192 start_codon:yes stop_codon:yes gene_type:complete
VLLSGIQYLMQQESINIVHKLTQGHIACDQERKIAFTAKIKNIFCIDVDYNPQAIGYFFAMNA